MQYYLLMTGTEQKVSGENMERDYYSVCILLHPFPSEARDKELNCGEKR